jgi:GTPase SAR1 family protein
MRMIVDVLLPIKHNTSKHIFQRCCLSGSRDFSVILVGNKIDLGNSRKVTTSTGFQKANEEIKCLWTETSAMLSMNVNGLFDMILNLSGMMKSQRKLTKVRRPTNPSCQGRRTSSDSGLYIKPRYISHRPDCIPE